MDDLRVLFFGDSFVAGVGDETGLGWVGRCTAAAFSAGFNLTAYNLGVRRETSRDVLLRWERELQPRSAAGASMRVVFSFGANDTTIEGGSLRVPPDETVRNLGALLKRCNELGVPALVVGPVPIGYDAQRARVVAASERMADTAAAHRVPFVELAAVVDRSDWWQEEVQSNDDAHPASAGYAHLAALIVPAWLLWLNKRGRSNPAAVTGIRSAAVAARAFAYSVAPSHWLLRFIDRGTRSS